MTRLIFQLGTNNWQRNGEYAPGSGILHEAHHHALNSLPDTAAYSMYPSKTQRFREERIRVFELDHDIPICESISPVSSYRWHGMSPSDFDAYCDRLATETEMWIAQIERAHEQTLTLAVAHHTFVNPLVMQRVNDSRASRGRPRIPVLCFVHGTAMKMFDAEALGTNQIEFPKRFLPIVEDSGIFGADPDRAVDWCAAISTQQVDRFSELFPTYPTSQIELSPNGYNQEVFRPIVFPSDARSWRNAALNDFVTTPYEDSTEAARRIGQGYDAVVMFCGKFAEWKRLDALLRAAALYETWPERIATVIAGSGPHDDQVHYQDLARIELGLKHTYFVGPQPQDQLAKLFTAADVACFPSKNEPFGLVFIEAMACGTPVIGVNSGGPRDFVTDEVGVLVPECDDVRRLGGLLAAAVRSAITDDWKRTKGAVAANMVMHRFSVRKQVEDLLTRIESSVPANA